jgi:hypothetical protein
MQQPVIQFGASIDGKDFSGSALNRLQKSRHALQLLFALMESIFKKVVVKTRLGSRRRPAERWASVR